MSSMTFAGLLCHCPAYDSAWPSSWSSSASSQFNTGAHWFDCMLDRDLPKPTVPRKKVSRPAHFPAQQPQPQPQQQQQQQGPASSAEPAAEAVFSAAGDEMSTAGQSADLRAPQADAGAVGNGNADASVSGRATAAPAAVPEGPCLEYDLQRRPVEWKPYPPSSYLGTDLDPKSAKYWRLGGLGKDENENWQVCGSSVWLLLCWHGFVSRR